MRPDQPAFTDRPLRAQNDPAVHRARAKEHLELARKADAVAALAATDGGAVLLELLNAQIDIWEKRQSWETLNGDAHLNQGKATRSRELRAYLQGAVDVAQKHREEAIRITDYLEAAANEGKIPRV